MEHDQPTPVPPPVMQVEQDQHCVGCSYNLRGLPVTGRCPECGALVERSLRGDLLEYSSPDYLAALTRGLRIVVIVTIAQLAAMVLLTVAAIALVATAATSPTTAWLSGTIELALSWVNAAFALVIVYGWYLFSTPDPAIVGSDKGDTPRKVVRIAAIASFALTVLAAVVTMLPTATAGPAVPVAQEVVAGSADMLSAVAGIVLYFASLIYVRWIARRIPSRKLETDATRLMWLGPLLYIVLACILIGPLVAVILYLVLLNQARKQIEAVRATQAPLYPE